MRRSLLALAITLSVSISAVQARENHQKGGDISRVNGGITAEAGTTYGDLGTVNGGISVRKGATAQDVETVNGGITLDDDASVSSVSAVNGGIRGGERVKVARDVETVNGGIRFDFHSKVGGDISTVNGGITIKQTTVSGKLRTVSGDITVGAQSLVQDGILVEKSQGISWGKPRIPRIVIGPDATVKGDLRFEREVELFVHTSAKVGPVSGATASAYTDSLPSKAD